MYKKLLIACISVGILCHGTEEQINIQENKPTTLQKIVDACTVKNEKWAWFTSVLCGLGCWFTGFKATDLGVMARNNMREGFELNRKWVELLKKNAELDMAPSVKNMVDAVVEQTKNWDVKERFDLQTYAYKVLRDAQKLPGDLLIEKSHANLAWQGYYHVAFTALALAAYAALVYCICKNLPEQQNNADQDMQESEKAENIDDAQIKVDPLLSQGCPS